MDEQEISFGGVAEPMVEAAPRIGDVPQATRGVRSGPLAAIVATAVIVAATAIPSTAKFRSPVTAPSAVSASFNIEDIPALENLRSLQLGSSFEDFTLFGSECSWDDRADGSSTLRVRLTSNEDPSTFLFGDLTLKGRIASDDMEVISRRLFAGAAPQAPGAGGWLRKTGPEPDVDVYTSLAGTLMGAGDLEGATVAVRNLPGTAVRRGPWSTSIGRDSLSFDDTIFARIIWLRETDSADQPIQSEGGGSLSLYLASAADDE